MGKVLIVEDHKGNQELVVQQISLAGLRNVEAVEDGLQATRFLEAHGEDVSLIVAAWEQYRHGRDLGEGTLEVARNKNPNVRIIIMTNSPERCDYFKSIGADHVLVKPFLHRDLFAAVDLVQPLQ